MKTLTKLALAAALFAAATPASAAPGSKLIATHGDWEAYTFSDKNGKVCYIASLPKSAGGAKDRETFASVTHRPADNANDVVAITAGYEYAAGSEVEVSIDGRAFKLFTSGDGAWAKDSATDREMVEAMKKGMTMKVTGNPAKGKPTTDTYSLSGFTASYQDISRACGVK